MSIQLASTTVPLAPGASVTIHPGWLSPAKTVGLFAELSAAPGWKQEELKIMGRPILEPRLSIGYGTAYRYSGIQRTVQPWTSSLTVLRDAVSAATGAPFNQAIVQLYRDGRDSIGEHADDEAALGEEPTIAAVSLGGQRRMLFRAASGGPSMPVDLTNGSLLVMSGSTQKLYRHGIPKVARAAPRLSVTFRMVNPR